VTETVSLFWDQSDCAATARLLAERYGEDPALFRLHPRALFELALRGRRPSFTYVAGNPDAGIEEGSGPHQMPRPRTGEHRRRAKTTVAEIAGSHLLHLELAGRLVGQAMPETLVLVLGSGGDRASVEEYIRQCDRALALGWQLDCLAWAGFCDPLLKAYMIHYGVFRDLAHWYEQISLVEGVRGLVGVP